MQFSMCPILYYYCVFYLNIKFEINLQILILLFLFCNSNQMIFDLIAFHTRNITKYALCL